MLVCAVCLSYRGGERLVFVFDIVCISVDSLRGDGLL